MHLHRSRGIMDSCHTEATMATLRYGGPPTHRRARRPLEQEHDDAPEECMEPLGNPRHPSPPARHDTMTRHASATPTTATLSSSTLTSAALARPGWTASRRRILNKVLQHHQQSYLKTTTKPPTEVVAAATTNAIEDRVVNNHDVAATDQDVRDPSPSDRSGLEAPPPRVLPPPSQIETKRRAPPRKALVPPLGALTMTRNDTYKVVGNRNPTTDPNSSPLLNQLRRQQAGVSQPLPLPLAHGRRTEPYPSSPHRTMVSHEPLPSPCTYQPSKLVSGAMRAHDRRHGSPTVKSLPATSSPRELDAYASAKKALMSTTLTTPAAHTERSIARIAPSPHQRRSANAPPPPPSFTPRSVQTTLELLLDTERVRHAADPASEWSVVPTPVSERAHYRAHNFALATSPTPLATAVWDGNRSTQSPGASTSSSSSPRRTPHNLKNPYAPPNATPYLSIDTTVDGVMGMHTAVTHGGVRSPSSVEPSTMGPTTSTMRSADTSTGYGQEFYDKCWAPQFADRCLSSPPPPLTTSFLPHPGGGGGNDYYHGSSPQQSFSSSIPYYRQDSPIGSILHRIKQRRQKEMTPPQPHASPSHHYVVHELSPSPLSPRLMSPHHDRTIALLEIDDDDETDEEEEEEDHDVAYDHHESGNTISSLAVIREEENEDEDYDERDLLPSKRQRQRVILRSMSDSECEEARERLDHGMDTSIAATASRHCSMFWCGPF